MERIASGISGAEGPVFDRDGRLFCVEPPTGKVLEILADGALRELANTGGIPAGLQLHADGSIWIADMKLGILQVHADGRVVHIVREFDAKPIRGCNDLCFDSRGNLYFTAPAGSNDQHPTGEVYRRSADGVIERIESGYAFCNGIAVSADDQMLIVAETFTKRLWAYDLDDRGRSSNKRVFAMLPGEHRGGPDGIDFDERGNLLAANWGGGAIEVFDPTGRQIDRIVTPFAQPSNLHFGGESGRTLIITEHTNNAVWRTTWEHAGLLAQPRGRQ